nr:hypothetical protein [Bacillus licheniformis]
MAKGYTNEGTKWEFAHSFWLVFTWVPFGFLSWFAFIYIAARTKQGKWLFAGIGYATAVLLVSLYSQNVPLRFGNESITHCLDHLNHSCFQNKSRIFGAA